METEQFVSRPIDGFTKDNYGRPYEYEKIPRSTRRFLGETISCEVVRVSREL
jgi:hypothetical protein